jgi:hypothetical protein
VHCVEISLLLQQQQLQHINADSADDMHMPMPIVVNTFGGLQCFRLAMSMRSCRRRHELQSASDPV